VRHRKPAPKLRKNYPGMDSSLSVTYIPLPDFAGWSSPVARQAHNLKVLGSNPSPATTMSAPLSRGFARLSGICANCVPAKAGTHAGHQESGSRIGAISILQMHSRLFRGIPQTCNSDFVAGSYRLKIGFVGDRNMEIEMLVVLGAGNLGHRLLLAAELRRAGPGLLESGWIINQHSNAQHLAVVG
jgi:hypothetical protein